MNRYEIKIDDKTYVVTNDRTDTNISYLNETGPTDKETHTPKKDTELRETITKFINKHINPNDGVYLYNNHKLSVCKLHTIYHY